MKLQGLDGLGAYAEIYQITENHELLGNPAAMTTWPLRRTQMTVVERIFAPELPVFWPAARPRAAEAVGRLEIVFRTKGIPPEMGRPAGRNSFKDAVVSIS